MPYSRSRSLMASEIAWEQIFPITIPFKSNYEL
jgi:hypothetical protein